MFWNPSKHLKELSDPCELSLGIAWDTWNELDEEAEASAREMGEKSMKVWTQIRIKTAALEKSRSGWVYS